MVFENPNIVKIFYAGFNDIKWMDRDYNLKIINFYDVQMVLFFLIVFFYYFFCFFFLEI